METKNIKVNKKVGADGLSKKERRALKVQGTVLNKPGIEALTKNGHSPPKDEESLHSKDKNLKLPDQNVNIKPELTAIKKESKHCVNNSTEVNNKLIPENINSPSKSSLRAERRALQEAQRHSKLTPKPENVKEKQPVLQIDKQEIKPKALLPKKDILKLEKSHKHKVLLFNHLYFENTDLSSIQTGNLSNTGVHPVFLRLGSQFASKTVLGSNARCLALLSALKQLILDFTTPPKQEFCRSLEATMQTCFAHINACRPPAVSMMNALRHFKLHLSQINTNVSDAEKRGKLLECIEIYINDEIAKAGEAISMQVFTKISNGDVILTYACSSLITKILLDAHKQGKNFSVIVVDARPLLEGKEMLRKLVCAGIQCTYILINAASFVMSRVSKVLLGAHALLANGCVMSRTGTAQVALTANAHNKPVLVCCETYKFCERAQTDSFVYNEIGDPDKLVGIDTLEGNSPLTNWQNSNYLTPLNLMYDVTPPDLVTAVVTELAFLPCTSVPVILRIRPTEIMA